MAEISIIVPNYNTEKYLPRCLDSLIHQTFQEIEIIVIDDGSTDNSIRIIKTYAAQDNRIKVIKQQNSGPAKARNQGLENATGKYLMFCDSDDWYEPDMCEVMYMAIEKEKTDVVCCHNFFDWEENLSESEKEERSVAKYYNPNRFGKRTLNDDYILSTNVLVWNKIWRRDLVEQYHISFPSGHEHDDDAFWYMYGTVAKNIYYLKKQLYHYFLRSCSIMSTQVNKKPKNRMDRISISEYVLEFLIKHNLLETHKILMAKIFKTQLTCAGLFFAPNEIEELCQKINLIFHTQLGLENHRLIYLGENSFLILKNKNKEKLIFEWLWYHLCVRFWGILKTEWGQAHHLKYIYRIERNRICWKYLNGEIK